MYLSTMDETTLLEPIAQFTNGDLLNMSAEEWRKQINYLRVLLELIAKKSDDSASGVAMFAQNEDVYKRQDVEFAADYRFEEGDTVSVVGKVEKIDRFERTIQE